MSINYYVAALIIENRIKHVIAKLHEMLMTIHGGCVEEITSDSDIVIFSQGFDGICLLLVTYPLHRLT